MGHKLKNGQLTWVKHFSRNMVFNGERGPNRRGKVVYPRSCIHLNQLERGPVVIIKIIFCGSGKSGFFKILIIMYHFK